MTKKFQFTDLDGRLKEAEAYAAEDFVSVAAPNAPVVTGPSGQLDPSLIPPLPAGQALSVAITRKTSEPILRGDAGRATTLNHVRLATRDTDLGSATVLGIALNNAFCSAVCGEVVADTCNRVWDSANGHFPFKC